MSDDPANDLAAVASLTDTPVAPAVTEWLRAGSPVHLFGLPLLGLPIGLAPDNIWGATALLQALRPDLPRALLVIRLLDGHALCVGTTAGAPLLEIHLHGRAPPIDLNIGFQAYFAQGEADIQRATRVLERVDEIIAAEKHDYDHVKGGALPRAHRMRLVRSCVHDVVVGLAAIRQDDRRNETAVDLFECTDHQLYTPGHGARSLAGLVLAEAYKAGASMAIRFEPVGGLRGPEAPAAFVALAQTLGVALGSPQAGRISRAEGVAMLIALSGLSSQALARARMAAQRESLPPEALAYLVISRCWTKDEVEWVLGAAPRPAAILFGDDGPEDRLAQAETEAYGRAAILATMFRSSLNGGGEEGVEATACEIRSGLLDLVVRRPACSFWDDERMLAPHHRMIVAVRPRAPLGYERALICADAETLSAAAPPGAEPVLIYAEEAAAVDLAEAADRIAALGVRILFAPYTLADLDELYERRLARARLVRR